MHQLPRRHISHICCKRDSGKHLPTKFTSGCVSFGGESDVSQPWRWPSYEHTRRAGMLDATCTTIIYALWAHTAKDVEVRPRGGLRYMGFTQN